MAHKPAILLIESTVQAVNIQRRSELAKTFDLLYYDCPTTTAFISALHGPYSHITAIIRTGWHKVGPFATHRPFGPDVVPHFPPSLKLICSSGHGHDAADVPALTARGIWYCNTPDTCTEAVANTALALVLDTFRYLTYAGWCARYDWAASREIGLKAVDPCGKTLGVVGLGDIGMAVARKCEAALGMRVCYYGPRRKDVPWTYHADVDGLIVASDCIAIAAPYTEETHHLLDRRRLRLKKGLRVVNIARGKMIDEEALVDALADGSIVGVGLDVHYDEPNINAKLRENWQVSLLPHVGVCSKTSWDNFEKVNWDNLEAFFRTGKPLTPVNNIPEANGC